MIGIIGLGYVGLPILLRFAESGYRVLGFDVESTKIEKLMQGQSYINHISSEPIASVCSAGLCDCTTDFTRAGEADVLIICVPTPLNKYREPDLSFVIRATESIVPFMRPGQLVSLESTTYPGTTDEELRSRIESTGMVVGQDIFLCFHRSGKTREMAILLRAPCPRYVVDQPTIAST